MFLFLKRSLRWHLLDTKQEVRMVSQKNVPDDKQTTKQPYMQEQTEQKGEWENETFQRSVDPSLKTAVPHHSMTTTGEIRTLSMQSWPHSILDLLTICAPTAPTFLLAYYLYSLDESNPKTNTNYWTTQSSVVFVRRLNPPFAFSEKKCARRQRGLESRKTNRWT